MEPTKDPVTPQDAQVIADLAADLVTTLWRKYSPGEAVSWLQEAVRALEAPR